MATWGGSKSWAAGQEATSDDINEFILNNILCIYPIGSLIYIHAAPSRTETTLLNKFIECNGAAVSAIIYSGLFSLIGTTFGNPGGGQFNLPDLAGRSPVAISAAGGHADVTSFANSEGATLANRRPRHAHTFSNSVHSHTWSGTTGVAGSHFHFFDYPVNQTGVGLGAAAATDLQPDNAGFPDHTTSGGGWDGHTHTYTPSISAALAVSSIGPTSARPVDSPAYLVGGVWMIAYA